MLKAEQVPEEVWVQLALKLESCGAIVSNDVAKLVAAEVINAWPRSYSLTENDSATIREVACFILPLTEASDD